jgi:hypothetical protein
MNLIWPHPLTLSPIGLGVGRAVLLAALWLGATGLAQTPAEIYRCGNAYTNQPVAGADCARMGATPVTVIEGTRVHATPGAPVSPATTGAVSNPRAAAVSDAAPNTKVDAQAQRERDQQARQILEAELAKAIAAQAEIARLWNNGEPHKQGDEFKNPARYQERVAQMRMALMRSESDIAGLRREIARLGAAAVKP